MSVAPKVSVVVPVRLAVKTVRSTLDSLLTQVDEATEVIAVVSEDDPSAHELSGCEHPRLRVLAVTGENGVAHLRRLGVAHSRAPFVAITEDHCLFPASWICGLVDAMERNRADASGGPVTNGRLSYVGWAQYFTRYSAFMPPVSGGWTTSLPGNNACYRRQALQALAKQWEQGFWEAEFNHELLRSGGRMWMCPELPVVQRQQRGPWEYFPLRFRHGRCYGARRIAAAPEDRGRLLLRSPLIPAVLYFRALRAVLAKRHGRLHFALTSPLVLVYFLAWSAGEIAGYLFGAGGACQETD